MWETLTADTSDIADEDGLESASFSYQWLAGDGGTDSEIDGATGSTYTVTTDDVGKAIRVRVSFTDDRGHRESLNSAATASVAGLPPPPLTASVENAPGVPRRGERLHLRAALQRGAQTRLQEAAGPCLHGDRRDGEKGGATGEGQQHRLADHGPA